jgi:hypothetical protein
MAKPCFNLPLPRKIEPHPIKKRCLFPGISIVEPFQMIDKVAAGYDYILSHNCKQGKPAIPRVCETGFYSKIFVPGCLFCSLIILSILELK